MALGRREFTAFGGSRCQILVPGGRASDLDGAVRRVIDFEARFTRFDPRSELMRFNASAGERVDVSDLLHDLLLAALGAHRLSGGLVNAAVHAAMVAAGYDRTIEEVQARHPSHARSSAWPRGNDGAVRARAAGPRASAALAHNAPPGHDGSQPTGVPPLPEILEVGSGWARLAPGCAVDLGAVAKGWFADRLCERFENATVNLGGDLRARGEGPRGGGWVVALCDDTRVRVSDGGVATSGVSRRRWRGGHHLIDPRSGRCAATDIAAVSVAARDAFTAEVLATGAAILGAHAAPEWLRARSAARFAILRDATVVAPRQSCSA